MGTLEVVIRLSRSGMRCSDWLTVVSSQSARFTVRRSNSSCAKRVPCSTTGCVDFVDGCSIIIVEVSSVSGRTRRTWPLCYPVSDYIPNYDILYHYSFPVGAIHEHFPALEAPQKVTDCFYRLFTT